MPRSIPSYRHHKARNLAVVRIDGKDHYLGRYNSPESKAKYHRLIAEWHAGSQTRGARARAVDQFLQGTSTLPAPGVTMGTVAVV